MNNLADQQAIINGKWADVCLAYVSGMFPDAGYNPAPDGETPVFNNISIVDGDIITQELASSIVTSSATIPAGEDVTIVVYFNTTKTAYEIGAHTGLFQDSANSFRIYQHYVNNYLYSNDWFNRVSDGVPFSFGATGIDHLMIYRRAAFSTNDTMCYDGEFYRKHNLIDGIYWDALSGAKYGAYYNDNFRSYPGKLYLQAVFRGRFSDNECLALTKKLIGA